MTSSSVVARRRGPRRRRRVESGRAVNILSAVSQGDPENDVVYYDSGVEGEGALHVTSAVFEISSFQNQQTNQSPH